jgi:hypothetical protein
MVAEEEVVVGAEEQEEQTFKVQLREVLVVVAGLVTHPEVTVQPEQRDRVLPVEMVLTFLVLLAVAVAVLLKLAIMH